MKMVKGSSSQEQGIEQDDQTDDQTEPNIDVSGMPPQNVIRLWQDVSTGIDRSQTVVWKAAVETLDHALRYLSSSCDARRFVEGHMRPCISILLDQQPLKIGQMEKNCVEESLRRAVQIVAKDLDLKKGALDDSDGALLQESVVLDALSFVFNRKKTYYKVSTPNWKTPCGAPEVRIQMINKFRSVGGWVSLATYLENRARLKLEQFPNAEALHHILGALSDIVPNPSIINNTRQQVATAEFRDLSTEEFSVRICQTVMNYIDRTSDESSWKKQANDVLSKVIGDLKQIFDKLASFQREETLKFYEFWRKLTLKLITSQSLPVRLFGWEQVGDLIDASREMRPPPKSYFIEGAGLSFVNGEYFYGGQMDEDGYASRGGDISYFKIMPATSSTMEGSFKVIPATSTSTEGSGGRKITLFRCTMRSQLKWWFLSEADEDQPGTDKDIDYYQHKTRTIDDSVPPMSGWLTCRNAGHDPPPTLRSSGVMVPMGEELNTLEHQLAKWAISNGVIELVLGDSVHREVVSRSKDLIRFLADMCDKSETPGESNTGNAHPNQFCLQSGHLLLAWRTCTSKADAAVSVEVYTLLVSILPSLPVELAICLLSAMQKSLQDGAENDKHDLLPEVSDFCSALAKVSSPDNNAQAPFLADSVRKEILKLLWEVLTHPGAPSLKTYEQLKHYVASELQVEPHGEIHRRNFLESCMEEITRISEIELGEIDEALAIQKVKLTRFILETCPQRHAISLVTNETPQLPLLLFRELLSYLMRRASMYASPNSRRTNSSFSVNGHATALFQRLSFLRFAYRLSFDATMTNAQLDKLWDLCSAPTDREALMIFLAEASDIDVFKSTGSSSGEQLSDSVASQPSVSNVENDRNVSLPAAFSNDTCTYAFNVLICAPDVNWDVLGEKAYHSFHTLFCSLRKDEVPRTDIHGTDIDAMWRIFLTSGNSDVASQAMKDLLIVYTSTTPQISSFAGPVSQNTVRKWAGDPGLGASEKSFVKRIFECLVQVKKGLEAGNPTSERSAERCLRILNAAFGQETIGIGEGAVMPDMSAVDSAAVALACVPHGMKGESCYRTINILGKHTSPQSHSVATVAQSHSALQEDLVGPASAPTFPVTKSPSTEKFLLNVHPLETLLSIKIKVSQHFKHPVDRIKAISISGRTHGKIAPGEVPSPSNLNIVPEETTVSELGITDGCEIMFLLAGNPLPASSNPPRKVNTKQKPFIDLASVFTDGDSHGSEDHFFDTLLSVLEALPVNEVAGDSDLNIDNQKNSSALVWDLLLAMSSNPGIVERVKLLASGTPRSIRVDSVGGDSSRMALDQMQQDNWSSLLDGICFHRSVYTLQVVESFLTPAPEILCNATEELTKIRLKAEMLKDAVEFRRGFINTGGFEAVLRLFTQGSNKSGKRRGTRRSDATALRVLKCCLMGNVKVSPNDDSFQPDNMGEILLESLGDPSSLLYRLTEVGVTDSGVPDSTILNSLCLIRLLLSSRPGLTNSFASLPHDLPEKYVTSLLLRKDKSVVMASAGSPAAWVRKCTGDLVMKNLSFRAFPWLITALQGLDVTSENTLEFFDALHFLVDLNEIEPSVLKDLGTVTCMKMAEQSRHMNTLPSIECVTRVLSGCLNLLKVVIEVRGGEPLVDGAAILVSATRSKPWSKESSRAFELNPTNSASLSEVDAALIDLMGAVFDGFLSSSTNPMLATPCCDKESRQLAFDVVATAAKACNGGVGYIAVVRRIDQVISYVAPYLRHRWCLNLSGDETSTRSLVKSTKYSGLRNQGCTCYMNSFLQQLFMMSNLRKNLCSAPIPTRLRSGGVMFSKEIGLVEKKITLQWETGMSYDAVVNSFDPKTGMHTLRYCIVPTVTGASDRVASTDRDLSSTCTPLDYSSLSLEYPDEFILAEGRPGKETGVFEISTHATEGASVSPAGENASECLPVVSVKDQEETEDQACARRLLEEVQRTFVHLEEGARGRCFDPRSLVEVSVCLKLEFDVWQQNDASEYAMKLLDRLEVPLKRYAPKIFRCLENTFGLKQTKQKYCKECGLKTNREENMMNIDCQIRGKSDIHEALETMCEVEYMEGDNKVFCDRCKKKCDTVLRTAISALPKVLVLSLKRFDLDYNTFETIKLNSRCAFGHRLNMRKYTLEGVEAIDTPTNSKDMAMNSADGDAVMDSVDAPDALASFPDEDYEYNLVGVLVHAGVAQGGHYYSFIKDRTPSEGETADKWYRFDDEDVSPFDPINIEPECFGGKVKKETKWPNGQLHTVESEQFANALMLFYEKVTPCNKPFDDDESNSDCAMEDAEYPRDECSNGYDVFQTDVRRANTTHAWCDFLSDSDFQDFVRNLIKMSQAQPSTDGESDKMELSPHRPLSPSQQNLAIGSWYLPIFQVSLMYLFDVLWHSFDKVIISQWVQIFCSVLEQDNVAAEWLTNEIARRTSAVSGNWLRTFCAECPDETARAAFMTIITIAIRVCSSCPAERECLKSWSQAWLSQLPSSDHLVPDGPVKIEALSTRLGSKCRDHEDIQKIGTGLVSSIGIVISEIAALLEHAPLSWRNSVDMCALIRDLSCCPVEEVRVALVAAQIPARLICLTIRESSPMWLKVAFPGSSLSQESASLMVRPEGVHSSHAVLPHGIGAGGGLSAKITERHDDDYVILLEALGCVIGLDSVKRSPFLVDELDQKGRPVARLSMSAIVALTQLFNESKSASAGGMGPREVEQFMKSCGYNPRNHVSQKIMQRLSKYDSVVLRDGNKEGRYLTLAGFLDYYSDLSSQGNESQVRSELHALGFRPDLSRRPLETRIVVPGEPRVYDATESVSLDVALYLKDRNLAPLGYFAETGLSSFHLYFLPFTHLHQQGDIVPLIEYILAASAYRRDSTSLLIESLEVLNEACTGTNNGHDTMYTCIKIFKVLLSVPDDKQNDRFQTVMRSVKRIQPYSGVPGIGLFVAARDLSMCRTPPHYSTENFHYVSAADRYVEIVSILFTSIQAVADWMGRNRELWSWMEQRRGDRDRTREATVMQRHHPSASNHNQFSDSNVVHGVGNESEGEDEDYRLDQSENMPRASVRCEKVEVSGAGLEVINGVYKEAGFVDGVAKYIKPVFMNDKNEELSLYRCQLQDGSRKWFISVVPEGQLPGTNKDIDYYWASCSNKVKGNFVPPEDGWELVKNTGEPPCPLLRVIIVDDEELNVIGQSSGLWNDEEDVIEDEGEPHTM